jgi:GTP pyrophosphokinase
LDEIEKHLGIAVRVLLQGIQKIDAFSTQTNKHIRQTENLRRMLFAIVEDVRVVLIKLASHTAEMRLTKNLNEATRKQKAEETQEIYAPLANRLGIGQLKWELEDLAFRYLDPNHYQQIAQFLHEKRLDREDYIEEVVSAVNNFLLKQDIQPHISGRAKHIYSIWKKMQRKGVNYHEIYDVRAIRILVPTLQDYYAALGAVHSLWQHIPKEFDDYIANPKENGYRSLHTAVK